MKLVITVSILILMFSSCSESSHTTYHHTVVADKDYIDRYYDEREEEIDAYLKSVAN